MSEVTAPKGTTERLTAVEREVDNVKESVSLLREEFRAGQKRSDENFDKIWDHQSVIGDKIESLGKQLQTDTENLSGRLTAGRQINWGTFFAGCGVLAVIIGMVCTGLMFAVDARHKLVLAEVERVKSEAAIRDEYAKLMTEQSKEAQHFKTLYLIHQEMEPSNVAAAK